MSRFSMSVLLLAVTLLCYPVLAVEDFKDFAGEIAGEYTIELAGDHKPKPEVSEGSITLSDTKAQFAFPYCASDDSFCDLGFRSFPFEHTQVEFIDVQPPLAYIVLEKGTTRRIYEWQKMEDGRVIFRDMQYSGGGALPQKLEFVLKPIVRPE